MTLKSYRLLLLLIPVVFLAIYFRIFYTDYAYLDEAHQLWNNQDDSNFRMFHSQGRWLTGLLFQELFASLTSIEQLKWVRILSFGGWIITTILIAALFSRWLRYNTMPAFLLWPVSLFVACCAPVAVYIGWASCFEIFLSVMAGGLSGHLLFRNLYTQQGNIHISNWVILGSLALGGISLFIYQTSFGVFLLPFFLRFMQRGLPKPDRVVIIGIVFYLVTYLVYYLLFLQSLKAYDMEASNRTAIGFDIPRKISFFFSGPLQQAFGINVLFSPRNLIHQIIFPAVIIGWVITVFKRHHDKPIAGTLGYIAMLIVFLALIYLALLISKENFDSYRTLFAFNLAVFILVADALRYWLERFNKQRIFLWATCTWLLITGHYNFNRQFIKPLGIEYQALRGYLEKSYDTSRTGVVFIRPEKFIFFNAFGVEAYRDEFGVPSTYRNWVPEPLVKQLVFELTGDRSRADSITVLQYERKPLFDPVKKETGYILIDMNKVFLERYRFISKS
jgi:hypothetical protein